MDDYKGANTPIEIVENPKQVRMFKSIKSESTNFNISKQSWTAIYKQKICNIFDPHVADFNYKLLNNLTSNQVMLKKWKVAETDLCTLCKEKEDNEHLILKCKNVCEIWRIVEKILNFQVSWKTIVIGFFWEMNEKTIFLNNLISLIACKIYKYRIYCRLQNKKEQYHDIRNHIKGTLAFNVDVYKRLNNVSFSNILDSIVKIL
jgi:hypothetical protein